MCTLKLKNLLRLVRDSTPKTLVVSPQTQKTVTPNFLLIEIAYFALLILSSPSSPRVPKSRLSALGSIPAQRLIRNLLLLIDLSFKFLALFSSLVILSLVSPLSMSDEPTSGFMSNCAAASSTKLSRMSSVGSFNKSASCSSFSSSTNLTSSRTSLKLISLTRLVMIIYQSNPKIMFAVCFMINSYSIPIALHRILFIEFQFLGLLGSSDSVNKLLLDSSSSLLLGDLPVDFLFRLGLSCRVPRGCLACCS